MLKPNVLIVDDRADDERAILDSWKTNVDLNILHPADISAKDMLAADVVVVDYRLDEAWEERDERSTISLQPMNGLALVGVLQSHERTVEGSPTAFVLRSAHLGDLSAGFPPDSRLHVIAWQNNLEWVINKNASLAEQLNQVESLAEAMSRLPQAWPDPAQTLQLVCEWLKLPEERWQQVARQDIEDCHPPLHDLTDRKHGLRLIRWLSHRILPYPCFLWTEARLCARLKVTRESMRKAINGQLGDIFAPVEYTGALHRFDGQRRWWHRGIEAILWDITSGRSFDWAETLGRLNERCDNELESLKVAHPVLCLNRDFRYQNEACEIGDAVRLQPDDWPAYAEQAWTSLDDARKEPRLEAAVISADRSRLKDSTSAEGG